MGDSPSTRGTPSGRGSDSPALLEVRGLNVFAGSRHLLREVNLSIAPRQAFGLVGPSGAGKSTLLRCLNRLIELDSSLRVEGDILLRGRSIRSPEVDADALRARVGMLFQQPVVFPVSIRRNVLFGVRHLRPLSRLESAALTQRALREAALWDEVKDRLDEPAAKLSVGQQQRLCLARALALDPEILLMDEPTSSLDEKSADAVEQLILKLKATRTIVLVTHNLGQARRVADVLARIEPREGVGEIVATGSCAEVLGARDPAAR
ncbi:MAG: ATP-binding cassette domain-containing protein [Verrucomicrobia bacterium]|nr:ATP-binding cassette domain-containing protein [Verrucomicrobiota bacterium]